MLVTDDRLVAGRDVVALARAAEAGGAGAVQLRLKHVAAREQVALTRALVAALRVPVLVNDRPDVAIAGGAAGVAEHADDLPVALARRIAPPGFVIGASVGSADEAAAAGEADYWGIGPWRVTGTKADAGAGLGAPGFSELAALAGGRPIDIEIDGGVTPENAADVVRAGANALVAGSAVFKGGDYKGNIAAIRSAAMSARGETI